MKLSIPRTSMARACQAGPARARVLKVVPATADQFGHRGRAHGRGRHGKEPMLRRLNVRTRLVAVIAVPLVLLLAVAVPEVLERRTRAHEASQAATVTTAVDDVAAAIDAIQGERTLSAAMRAGSGPDVARALEDQRAIVDPAVERALPALADLAREHSWLREPTSV